MRITRLDNDKTVDIISERIEIDMDGVRYTITPACLEGITINCIGDHNTITVKPCCGNEIVVVGS